MDWTTIAIAGGLVGIFLGLKKLGLVSATDARDLWKQGARVIDVRSAGEYQAGHLPVGENIPLNDLNRQIAIRVPDKETVLLLHCLSGTRSGMAKSALRGLGYTHVHNLGSYARAEGILKNLEKSATDPT